MNETPQRRWFRFRLRTLLGVVALLSGWLAWETNVVKHRQAVLQEIRAGSAFQVTTAEAWANTIGPRFVTNPLSLMRGTVRQRPARVFWLRRQLGDEAVQEIWFTRGLIGYSDPLLDRIRRAFPEAEFHEALPVPCHPGCFPPGTLVETPGGVRPIDSIQPGEAILCILETGQATSIEVQSVFVTTNQLLRIQTENGELLTTPTQPLCLSTMETVPAAELQPGTSILRFVDGGLHSVRVLQVTRTQKVSRVFNLVLGKREIFVAGGFLARSKPPAIGL